MVFSSLRSQLLAWLVAPLALISLVDGWVTYKSGKDTATLIQDQLLLGSARTIAQQVGVVEGRVAVTIPPAALEMLDSGSGDRVYYRASSARGRLIAGDSRLDMPPRSAGPEEWLAFDTLLDGQPLRVIAFFQPVFGEPEDDPVIIEVGQTLASRTILERQIWVHTVRTQLLVLVLVSALLAVGLRRGIQPLIALRDRMLRRKPGAFESIDALSVPSELRPLIAALNEYVARLDRHMLVHNRFIADASHQLRTPLAVLNTQVTYAMRSPAGDAKDATLKAMRVSLQSTVRLVNQLLAFTETEAGIGEPPSLHAMDINLPLCEVIEELALVAASRRVDLGFESSQASVMVYSTPHLIRMMAANLIDNAVRYSHHGGVVTVRVSRRVDGAGVLQVIDDGPGIPEHERGNVFERFYRLDGSDLDGCGLGLAIVREIATRCQATVELADPPSGVGLIVTVAFPPLPTPLRSLPKGPGAIQQFSEPSPQTVSAAI